MTKAFWQAKIWGLLHDPALKALHTNYGRGGQSFWTDLQVMEGWKDPSSSSGALQEHILSADYITSASDRSAIGSLSTSLDYDHEGLEIRHLLSGERIEWKLGNDFHQEVINLKDKARSTHFEKVEQSLFPDEIKQCEDPRLVFWWLWRCFPKAVCDRFNDDSLLLMPAETRIPDGSIWSHLSLTSAMAGALAGYDLTEADINRWTKGEEGLSRPYMAAFTFSPVQELIKASRKMRDFWAGSWILHYLSARVCWALAWKYGPDSLVYPSLYAQPLIDYWLLHGIDNLNGFRGFTSLSGTWYQKYVSEPSARQLLTAGFPNVIVLVLPEDKVNAAMQMAGEVLQAEWKRLGSLSFSAIREQSHQWMEGLTEDSETWQGWLSSQWQSYWSAVAVGDPTQNLRSWIHDNTETENPQLNWCDQQNIFTGLIQKDKCHLSMRKIILFQQKELSFLDSTSELRKRKNQHSFKSNVGSWWCYAFDQLRFNLQAVKSARAWEIPTAFGVRSTISGIGSVLHPTRKMAEESIKQAWSRNRAGIFDGREMLNATEVTKRALHKILPQLFPDALTENQEKIDASYPDLTAGVAGFLKISNPQVRNQYVQSCHQILSEFPEVEDVIHQMRCKWGIPYADEHLRLQKYHSRLLNAGWLVEDLQMEDEDKIELRLEIERKINQLYPNNNPADWYVLSAGDGDSMSEWLKGTPLKNYADYVPQKLRDKVQEYAERVTSDLAELEREVQRYFEEFLTQKKRMGASTHSALSRALLDFSNQLVPYLTEQRYAGRLIYGGGDDVLAYTNLWEWDQWLWDIRQCFRGQDDPHQEFHSEGDYWRWKGRERKDLSKRPLFTMGSTATISFGIVIAHHSVPLAIALENMWQAEASAKEHKSEDGKAKDAVQVRVIYGNGNILEATCKFDVLEQWKELLNLDIDITASDRPALFEQAATVWEQHPAPVYEAIAPWCTAFCDRREKLKDDDKTEFRDAISQFIKALWMTTKQSDRDDEIKKWLKLAAFILRKRNITIKV